jgi:hypothetical protein
VSRGRLRSRQNPAIQPATALGAYSAQPKPQLPQLSIQPAYAAAIVAFHPIRIEGQSEDCPYAVLSETAAFPRPLSNSPFAFPTGQRSGAGNWQSVVAAEPAPQPNRGGPGGSKNGTASVMRISIASLMPSTNASASISPTVPVRRVALPSHLHRCDANGNPGQGPRRVPIRPGSPDGRRVRIPLAGVKGPGGPLQSRTRSVDMPHAVEDARCNWSSPRSGTAQRS